MQPRRPGAAVLHATYTYTMKRRRSKDDSSEAESKAGGDAPQEKKAQPTPTPGGSALAADQEVQFNLNAELQERLKEHFKPLGIVAYSLCCRWGCTDSYEETDGDFKERFKGDDGGVYFIRLHLHGMNYNPAVRMVAASYGSFEYLMKNWDQEKALIDKFCEIVGKAPHEYKIVKPNSIARCIMIHFCEPLNLDEEVYEDEDDDY